MDPLLQKSASLPSPLNTHIENSTRFRGLPLFCTLFCLGKDGYTSVVRNNIEWARQLVAWLRIEGAGWEVLTPPDGFDVMNIVLFAPSGNCPNARLLEKDGVMEARQQINSTKEIYVSPTRWRGRPALRLAISNWMTGPEDLEKTKAVLSKVGYGMMHN
jgi:glutamate/tyrosine decarboxylase-like PLP-dependent enzyme